MKIKFVFVGSDALDERIPMKVGQQFTYVNGHLAVTVFDVGCTLTSQAQALPEWVSTAMIHSCQIIIKSVSANKLGLRTIGRLRGMDLVDLAFVATAPSSQGAPGGELLQQLLTAHQATIDAHTA